MIIGKKTKYSLLAATLVLLLAGGGYWAYHKSLASKEVAFACVATSFPYVIVEHKRQELTDLLGKIKIEDSDKDPDLDAVDKAMAGNKPPPSKYFLSQDIDTQMLKLASTIENRPEEAPPLSGEEMAGHLNTLVPLFEKQASAYFSDCKTLFNDIFDKCGSFDDNTEAAQNCRDQYDPNVNALLKKHLGDMGDN